MRQNAAGLNRTWLTVIGVLLLLAGLAVVVIGTGRLQSIANAAGLTLNRPSPTNRLFGPAPASGLGLPGWSWCWP